MVWDAFTIGGAVVVLVFVATTIKLIHRCTRNCD
jgi:hypothetical protein